MAELIKSYKFWAAIILAILVIVAVVLYFVNEKICYAVSGMFFGVIVTLVARWIIEKINK